ncbi:MAG: RpiB/LacA/LacB family sugar-phosphate isomerase [Candidatus Sungbacteria bacterium]|nr:RpiB/LacA/LacB family sugar-phosphate isomerase [Candidatus Sungbacteria bacterium]
MIYLASDHRGFQLKEAIKRFLTERGVLFEDCGAVAYAEGDDYVDFAVVAAKKIQEDLSRANEASRGIFLCGSGHGVDMVANKFRGIRAALCWNVQVAKQSREHEDTNVLVLPADWLDDAAAEEIMTMWLGTEFSGEERHVRRLEKIEELEKRKFS